MELSIIIPVYNASATLRDELPLFKSYLDNNFNAYEIIIVNDGSPDADVIHEICKVNKIRYINVPVNKGKGNAVRQGMMAAVGDYAIFTDADIPFVYENVKNVFFYLKNKEFDLVIGDRTLSQSQYFSEINSKRKWASIIFTFFVGRFITTGFNDTQCGLKGFRASIAKDLFGVSKINNFAFDVELLYIALKRNYDIKRIPVQFRNSSESSVSLLKHSIGMLISLFAIKYYHTKNYYKRK